MSLTSGLGPFVVNTAELRRRPGHVRRVEVSGALADLALSDSSVPHDAPVHAALDLEVVVDGRLTAVGEVRTTWVGRCRRCLREVGGELEVEVAEVFEGEPPEGAETYPLGADRVDLEPMVRDAVLLALPLAPLCGDDCAGPDPDHHPVGEPVAEPADPRWAALGELRFD